MNICPAADQVTPTGWKGVSVRTVSKLNAGSANVTAWAELAERIPKKELAAYLNLSADEQNIGLPGHRRVQPSIGMDKLGNVDRSVRNFEQVLARISTPALVRILRSSSSVARAIPTAMAATTGRVLSKVSITPEKPLPTSMSTPRSAAPR